MGGEDHRPRAEYQKVYEILIRADDRGRSRDRAPVIIHPRMNENPISGVLTYSGDRVFTFS